MEQANAVKDRVAAERAATWYPAIGGFAAVTALFIGLYWMTALTLVEIWAKTGMFEYCFLIFPISAWLIWNKRRELALNHAPAVCPWALVLLAGTIFVWLVGRVASVDVLEQAAFIATFPVLVLLMFGADVFLALLFPMIYLVFAIPAGHSVVAPLQRITAEISVQVLQWTNVPVLLQGGHYIITPSATWDVARACSGIRFFTACTAIGSLFAYVFFTSYWRRAIFIFASMIVPIIANGLRVYFTILIGETFGVQYAQGTDHMIFGWQFFGTVLFLLLLVGWFLREPQHDEIKTDSTTRHARGPGLKRVLPVAVVAAIVLGAAPAWASLISSSISPRSAPERLVLQHVGDWSHHADLPATGWRPSFQGADFLVAGRYSRAGDAVFLYAAAYDGAQVQGHDLLAYGNTVFNAERWHKVGGGLRTIALSGGEDLVVREAVLRWKSGYRLIWYWYSVNGRPLISPKRIKAWQAWDQLTGRGLRSSVIAVSSVFRRGEHDESEAAMKAFVRTLYPRVIQKLATVSRGGAG